MKSSLDAFQSYYFLGLPDAQVEEVRTLLVGDAANKGLLHLCGAYSRKRYRFKLVACHALGLLAKLLDPSENAKSDVFRDVFGGLDEVSYKQMRADQHLAGGENANVDAARSIQTFLKQQRGLDIATLVSEEAPKTFVTGLSTHLERELEQWEAQGKARFIANVKAKLAVFKRPTRKTVVEKGILREGVVFGQPLEKMQLDRGVPGIVRQCCSHMLDTGALQLEGLFRVSGELLEVQHLKKRVDFGEPVDLSNVTSPHSVSSLLKLFFRELPEPLLTYDHYDGLLARALIGDNKGIVAFAHDLPACHKSTLGYLLTFLRSVAAESSVNKMAAENLAIVFAPNLIRPRIETMQTAVKDAGYVIKTMEQFLLADLGEGFGEVLSRVPPPQPGCAPPSVGSPQSPPPLSPTPPPGSPTTHTTSPLPPSSSFIRLPSFPPPALSSSFLDLVKTFVVNIQNTMLVRSNMKASLAEFEKLYFSILPVVLPEEVSMLLLGYENKTGLLHLCGAFSRKQYRFKVAASLAIGLLAKLLDPRENVKSDVFRNVFVKLDETVYKEMRADQHMAGGGNANTDAARSIQVLLQQQRGLDVETLVSKEARKTFVAHVSENESVKKGMFAIKAGATKLKSQAVIYENTQKIIKLKTGMGPELFDAMASDDQEAVKKLFAATQHEVDELQQQIKELEQQMRDLSK